MTGRFSWVARGAMVVAVAAAFVGTRWRIGQLPRSIAHGGGMVRDRWVTNSREALEESVRRGFRWIEMDFCWSADGQLVAIHDWDLSFNRVFAGVPRRMTTSEFATTPMEGGLHSMTAEDLFRWLDTQPSISIVTDVKEDNLRALRWISDHYPKAAERFIPQVYDLGEWAAMRALGYRKGILTLYRTAATDTAIVAFARAERPLAVTMPLDRARAGVLPASLHEVGVPVYVHTINEVSVVETLRDVGVYGIYSDRLAPGDIR